ncbi:MAG: ATP-dependent 6-phosphofructokinase [Candidatus Dadabacteria bacterium]|nr:MAG: ATP-dependent 6-phosphofructokinase [Candidatus Dadabacteria bacterium]
MTATIGILTGGGDCPGLNAVIRGVTKSAIRKYGMKVVGFCDGFQGMIEGNYIYLTEEGVSGILTEGGTILGTSNVADPFNYYVEDENGGSRKDLSGTCMQLYEELGLTALICVGGDGTMAIGARLSALGANVVGVPKTIDKDVFGTDTTFGFDSARATATEAIDKLHTTADAHQRVMIVEVMGRNAGWLALESGIAGGGDIIIIPEIPYRMEKIVEAVNGRIKRGRRFSIVVVAEGAAPEGGDKVYKKEVKKSHDPMRLGGVGHVIGRELEELTGIECRVAVLGHVQRGGTPTPLDRLLATEFAVKAVELINEKRFNRMVALQGSRIASVEIEKVMGKQRTVPPDSDLVSFARAIGTSFGD